MLLENIIQKVSFSANKNTLEMFEQISYNEFILSKGDE